jgi:hypothetical protein
MYLDMRQKSAHKGKVLMMNENNGGANAIRSNNHGRKIWWESDGGESADGLARGGGPLPDWAWVW